MLHLDLHMIIDLCLFVTIQSLISSLPLKAFVSQGAECPEWPTN